MMKELDDFTVERLTQLANTPEKYDNHYLCNMLTASESRALSIIALAAKTSKLNSPEIPDGWKLVPIELTAEMAQAARDAHEGEAYLPYSIYRAMLSVSPLPPTELLEG